MSTRGHIAIKENGKYKTTKWEEEKPVETDLLSEVLGEAFTYIFIS